MSELKRFICETAKQAGEITLKYYGSIREGDPKGSKGDVVTQADLEAEKYIIGRISQNYPDHGMLAEESGKSKIGDSDYVWVIDPLDGTRNFSNNVPIYCVSIGLLKDNRPFAGGLYDPIHDEMYYADETKASTLNGKPIKVSDQSELEFMTVNLAWSMNKYKGVNFFEYACKIIEKTEYSRRYGSAALALGFVADSRLDATVFLSVKPWDLAAGAKIVERAGGKITDFQGNPVDFSESSINAIAANPQIHKKLLEEIFLS